MVDISGDEARRVEEEKETGRVEMFSDGVCAIAITLLVLEIRVPLPEELGGGSLVGALVEQWPVYLAYVFSFIWILVMWIGHHNMFRHIVRVDQVFLLLNGLLLMGITLVPFPTGLLAEYIRLDENPGAEANQRVAVLVYSGLSLVIAGLFTVMWLYAGGRLTPPGARLDYGGTRNWRYLAGPALFTLSVLLVFVNVWLSLAIYGVLLVFFAFPAGVVVMQRKRGGMRTED